MTNPALTPILDKARSVLAKAKEPLGADYCIDFSPAGALYVYGKTLPMTAMALDHAARADCTIALSLDELARLQSGCSVTWEVVRGRVHIDNQALAEKAAGLLKGP